jgi:hypothetical protein
MEQLECVNTRRIISTNIDWLNGLGVRLDISEEGYWEQTDQLDLALSAAEQAFLEKPSSCQMVCKDDDNYVCQECNFNVAANLGGV